VVNQLSFEGNYVAGETARIKFTIKNDKSKEEHVSFTLCDYACNSNGEHFYEPDGKEARSNRNWITLHKYNEILAPGSEADIYFTLKVPANPSLLGSYWSVIMIEPSSLEQMIQGEKGGVNIEVKVRFAYHVVTHVGEGTPKVKIVSKSFKTIDQQPLLTFEVLNEGSRFIFPKLILKLFNSAGKLEKTLHGAPERLYPGNSQRYQLSAEGLLAKKYKAYLVLDNEDKYLFGDSFEIEIP
jgi:hypothetical protein